MREIKHLSVHQWLRSAIPDSQQPISPIGFLFLKLPPPPCAVLLVIIVIGSPGIFVSGDLHASLGISKDLCLRRSLRISGDLWGSPEISRDLQSVSGESLGIYGDIRNHPERKSKEEQKNDLCHYKS